MGQGLQFLHFLPTFLFDVRQNKLNFSLFTEEERKYKWWNSLLNDCIELKDWKYYPRFPSKLLVGRCIFSYCANVFHVRQISALLILDFFICKGILVVQNHLTLTVVNHILWMSFLTSMLDAQSKGWDRLLDYKSMSEMTTLNFKPHSLSYLYLVEEILVTSILCWSAWFL